MNWNLAHCVGPATYIWRRIGWRLRRIAGCRPVVELANGVRWQLPLHDLFASDVFVTSGNVDLGCEHILLAYLRTCRCVGDTIDVGAHSGYYSLLLSSESSRVYAFEPDIRNFGMMDEIAASCGQIDVVREAVGDYCGTVSFLQAGNSDVSHIEPDQQQNPSGQGVVPITTLDVFAGQRNLEVTAVKIDVEGFDILVLEGAKRLALQQRPVFSVEFGLEAGRPNSWDRLEAFLAETRYVVWAVDLSFPSGKPLCRFALRSISDLKSVWTKMLFVVPAEDTFFAQFAAKFPSWGSERLGAMKVEDWIPS